MLTALPADAVAFGKAARSRFDALGGVRAAIAAETDDAVRRRVAAALDELGGWDIDPRGDAEDFLAAAQLCRTAGAVALPHPVVEQLLAIDGARLALVDPEQPWVDHGDLDDGPWIAVDLDGGSYAVSPEARRSTKLSPFLTPVRLTAATVQVPLADVDRHLVLGAWRMLGCLDAALALASAHVAARKQFGKALAEFQAVRFALADAVVAARGLEELAKFTAWRLVTASESARRADALALRLHATEVAGTVLRSCHQMFGAIGFCDEHDISVLDRHIQPLRRLPASAEALADRLVPAVSAGELESLFTTARP